MTQGSLSSPSVDTTLEVLSNASRREVLLSLSSPSEGILAQDDLVEPAEQTRTLELIHLHLPKLEDEGFIEWDRERGELRPGPRFEEARPLLVAIREYGRPDRN